MKNHKAIGFLSNTGPDPLKNHKATKPAFNVGPSLVRQRNAISMAFHWWAKYALLFVVFEFSLPSSKMCGLEIKMMMKTEKVGHETMSGLQPIL